MKKLIESPSQTAECSWGATRASYPTNSMRPLGTGTWIGAFPFLRPLPQPPSIADRKTSSHTPPWWVNIQQART
jgi:hypothetical protein